MPALGGADVVAYRIIEEALGRTDGPDAGHLAIAMRFVPDGLELRLSGRSVSPPAWPSSTITQRAAQCDGEILAGTGQTDEPQITIRLPRNLQVSLA